MRRMFVPCVFRTSSHAERDPDQRKCPPGLAHLHHPSVPCGPPAERVTARGARSREGPNRTHETVQNLGVIAPLVETDDVPSALHGFLEIAAQAWREQIAYVRRPSRVEIGTPLFEGGPDICGGTSVARDRVPPGGIALPIGAPAVTIAERSISPAAASASRIMVSSLRPACIAGRDEKTLAKTGRGKLSRSSARRGPNGDSPDDRR
jgi:hypothetical protein